MIKLTVEKCPNSDYLGSFIFDKNLIYVGNNIDADLYLEDSSLRSNHLFIEIVNDQLLAHLNKEEEFFLVNGKRTTKFKFLSPGHELKIGNCAIKVETFSATNLVFKREVLNQNTEELIRERSPLLDFINKLRKEL